MDFPAQVDAGGGDTGRGPSKGLAGSGYDPREDLTPPRLTIVMWDQAFLVRHVPGESFEHYDKVLDDCVERGYNTLRLDPLPNLIDLDRPDTVFEWKDPSRPFFPWGNNKACKGPAGLWLIEFMQKLLKRDSLHYTLSTWWFDEDNWCGKPGVAPRFRRSPLNHRQAAEIWAEFLRTWEKRFGFDRLVYVDIHNEIPYFMKGYKAMLKEKVGLDWDAGKPFTPEQAEFLADDINGGIAMLQREFPELRFTGSIHGDERWFAVPLQFDCIDAHFYLDPDARWTNRSRFGDFVRDDLFVTDRWFKEFSDRCMKAYHAVMPMLFQRQQSRLAAFAAWSDRTGMPLTTSESWATWFYVDHPDLDWSWLLKWAEKTVEGAIRHRMWGWTPHNYAQPQFADWGDVERHRKLTSTFLESI